MNADFEQLEQRIAADMKRLDALPPPPAVDAAVARARASVRRELARRRAAWIFRLLPGGGIAAALAFVWLSSATWEHSPAAQLAAEIAAEEALLDDWAAAFHDSGEQLVRQWLGGNSADSDEDSLDAELDAWGLSDEDDASGA